jgi:hypothetical protein
MPTEDTPMLKTTVTVQPITITIEMDTLEYGQFLSSLEDALYGRICGGPDPVVHPELAAFYEALCPPPRKK